MGRGVYGIICRCAFLMTLLTFVSGFRPSSLSSLRKGGFCRLSSMTMSTVPKVQARERVGLVWYKPTDIRLLDHQPLAEAHRESTQVLHAICLDDRLFGPMKGEAAAPGTLKTGHFRARFMLEGIVDMKKQLRSRGSDLLILKGLPEIQVVQLAQLYGVSTVYCHSEACSEELQMQRTLEAALSPLKIRVKAYFGNYLYHVDDLPFSIAQMPTVFTSFRKLVESRSKVRSTFEIPAMRPQPALPAEMPEDLAQAHTPDWTPSSLGTLGLQESQEWEEERKAAVEAGTVFDYKGGETAALARIHEYLWELDLLKEYKETRNGMLGPHYSSKFSPWLAHGNVSPRVILSEVKRYEKERVTNDSTYWLVFELIWRDFFRFIAMRFGNDIFKIGGPQRDPAKYPWVRQERWYRAWVEGRTGVPLIDACMRELRTTGFLGNRGRQIVASFCTKDLLLDWRMGAAYFEEVLLDYDPASNYGNWNYVAGVGSDPREDRYFNPVKQAQTYDSNGAYIRYWCPELSAVPTEMLHQPWLLDPAARRQYKVSGYPEPLVRIKAPSSSSKRPGGGGGSKQQGGRVKRN